MFPYWFGGFIQFAFMTHFENVKVDLYSNDLLEIYAK